MDERGVAAEVGPEVARAVARALGIAWVGATLYEDPLEQEAFGKAALRISSVADSLPPITVTPRTLRIGSRDLGEEGLSIERLAEACFVHGVGVLRFTHVVTPRGLATFLEVIRLPPESVAQEGGLARVLKRRLVVGVEVFAHQDAMEKADELTTWDDRWSWSSESLAAVLSSIDPKLLPETLLEGFTGAMAITGVKERQAAVTSHVEALMSLRPAIQSVVLDWIHARDEETANAIFQHLASHELDRLSRTLAAPASAGAAQVLTTRGDTALGRAISGGDGPHLDVEPASLPPADEWWDELLVVLQVLFGSDLARADQVALIETWATVFDGLLRAERFALADQWYDVPLEQEDPVFRSRTDGRRIRMPGREGLRALVGAVEEDPHAVTLLLRSLQFAPVHVLTLLGAFPDEELAPVIDVVGNRLAGDTAALLDGLPGLERPLEIALRIVGASGGAREGDPRLLAFLRHEHASVVVAALGAVGEAATADEIEPLLRRTEASVRRSAIEVLGRKGEDGVAPLAAGILADEMDEETAVEAARALRELPGGQKALDRTAADVQLLVSGRGRSLRKRLVAVAKGSE